MRATELVGKVAIRTGPNYNNDHSYCSYPVKILMATESHVMIEYVGREANMFSSTPHLLNCAFCDDKWADAEGIFKVLNGEMTAEELAQKMASSTTVNNDPKDEVSIELIPWCKWHITTKDYPNELSCTAHLHDGRCFGCPYNSPQEREKAQYPCQDYEPIEEETSPMRQVNTPQIPINKAQISFWQKLFGRGN